LTTYLSDPIPVDRASIRAQIDARADELLPGLDTTSPLTAYDLFANITAGLHAEALTTLTQVLTIVFRGSLEKVDRVLQRNAVQATATGTLTRTTLDAAGGERTVGAGAEFNVQGADGNAVAFQTKTDNTFTGTDDEIEGVELVAVLGGTGGNGLSTVQGPAVTVAWYQSLVLDGVTSGGQDGETDDQFLNRGADQRPGRAFTIVLPDDLARFLRDQPGVDRVQVVDNYDADTDDDAAGGHITAIPIDAAGAALSGGTMTALAAAAAENAVTGLEIHVIAPTDTSFAVVFSGYANAGYDRDDVQARAQQAISDLLDRARWGLPDGGDQRGWDDERILRFQDLVTALNLVTGFDYYQAPAGTANTSNGSPNLTSVTPTTGWVNGMPIAGTGIPANTKILSGAGTSTMVMTANATASNTGTTVTGTGLSVNGGTADVAMTGPGALPASSSTVAGEVQYP
jgi:hypothetical protein